METALDVSTALAALAAVCVSGLSARWSRQAAKATAEAARKTEWGLNFRAACERLASANERVKQLGVDQLLEMRSDGSLDDDQKRQLVGVTKYLLSLDPGRSVGSWGWMGEEVTDGS